MFGNIKGMRFCLVDFCFFSRVWEEFIFYISYPGTPYGVVGDYWRFGLLIR